MASILNTRRQLGAVMLGVAAIPATAHTAAAQTTDTIGTQANVAVVRRFLTEVVNGRRFDLVEELWAPDMLWRGASMGEVQGIAAYKTMLESSVGLVFSDMKLEILDVVASGDKVVVRFTNSGVNVGSYMGRPASGKYAIWEGVGIYRLKDGKIAAADFCEDLYGQLKMLGHLPA